jgi:ubiquitin C-terminal hydrolase
MSHKRHVDNYYLYRLRGVVIHAGGASAGHYYSLIKDSENSSIWREFNDSNVRSFDFQNMKEEAFGGRFVWNVFVVCFSI